jgi:ATP-dependent helicase/DNAse subunit B
MVYCGFKREISFGGWIIRPYYVEVKADCTEGELGQVMIAAKETTLNAIASILDGNIRPAPADESRCQFCAFSAICRVERLAVPAVAESVMA